MLKAAFAGAVITFWLFVLLLWLGNKLLAH